MHDLFEHALCKRELRIGVKFEIVGRSLFKSINQIMGPLKKKRTMSISCPPIILPSSYLCQATRLSYSIVYLDPYLTLSSPILYTGQSPVPYTGQSPVPNTGQSPVPYTGQSPVPYTGQSPVPYTGQSPVPYTGQSPVPYTGQSPVPYTGQSPVPYTGQSPVPYTGQSPVPNIGQSGGIQLPVLTQHLSQRIHHLHSIILNKHSQTRMEES